MPLAFMPPAKLTRTPSAITNGAGKPPSRWKGTRILLLFTCSLAGEEMREKDSIERRWRPLLWREVGPGSADRMLSSAGGLCGLPPQLLLPLRRSLLCRGIWMGGSSTRAIAPPPTGELLDASGRGAGWPLGIEWVRLSSSRRELSRRGRRVRWLLLAGPRVCRKPPRGCGGGGGVGDSTLISPTASGQAASIV